MNNCDVLSSFQCEEDEEEEKSPQFYFFEFTNGQICTPLKLSSPPQRQQRHFQPPKATRKKQSTSYIDLTIRSPLLPSFIDLTSSQPPFPKRLCTKHGFESTLSIRARKKVSLLQLPDDIIKLTLTFLTETEIFRNRAVSKLCQKLGNETFAIMTSVVINNQQTAVQYQKCKRLEHITIGPCLETFEDLCQIMFTNRHLIKSLVLYRSNASVDLAMKSNLTSLRQLTMYSTKPNNANRLTHQYRHTLTELNLCFVELITRTEFRTLTRNFRNIRTLSLENFKTGLCQHLASLEHLRSLELKSGKLSKKDYNTWTRKPHPFKLESLHFDSVNVKASRISEELFFGRAMEFSQGLTSFTVIGNGFRPQLMFEKLRRRRVVLPDVIELDIQFSSNTASSGLVDVGECDDLAGVVPNLESLTLRARKIHLQIQNLTKFCCLKRLEKLNLNGFFAWNVLRHVSQSQAFPVLKYLIFDIRMLIPVPLVNPDDEGMEIMKMFEKTKPNLVLFGGPIFSR